MSRHPHDPLTPEERALAARLPHLHGRAEPHPTMDASILAASRAITPTPTPGLRPRMRWIAPLAVAASLSLAVGLAWRVRPAPVPNAGAPMAVPEMADVPEARVATLPADARPAREPNRTSAAAAAPARQRPVAGVSPTAAKEQMAVAAPPPPPTSAPAPSLAPAETAAASGVMDAAAMAPPSSPAVAAQASRVGAGNRAPPAASPVAPPREQANEAAMAADAGKPDAQAFIGDDPDEDVPPATADSPEVREAWLRRIGELLQQGRSEEARASLAEFRRRYPDAPLPPELRKLEP